MNLSTELSISAVMSITELKSQVIGSRKLFQLNKNANARVKCT